MNYNLSETENQIMEFIWSENRSVRTGEIMDYFVKQLRKGWKRQTLNTLLIRLDEKELIHRSRGVVQAVYSKEDLLHQKCVDFVNENFAGNVEDFLMAYAGAQTNTDDSVDNPKEN